MAKTEKEPETDVIAETDEYMAWTANEPDGDTYHLELNNVTISRINIFYEVAMFPENR